MIMQEKRVREKIYVQEFYIGSLKLELHPVCQGNPSLILHYFKRFTKFTLLHFQNKQNTHKRLLNHTTITIVQQDTSYRPGKPLGTRVKLEKDQTSVVA